MLDILGFDLRARLRDRSALVIGVLAPLALMAVFSLAFGDQQRDYTLGYVKPAVATPIDGALRDGPIRELERTKLLKLRTIRDAGAARRAVDDGDVDAAITVAASARDPNRPTVTVLRSGQQRIAGMIADSIVEGVARRVGSIGEVIGAERVLAQGGGGGRAGGAGGGAGGAALQREAAAISQALSASTPPISFRDGSETVSALSPKTQMAAGMMTFFLLFTVQFGLLSLQAERRQGTLARLLAAPVTPWQVVLAKLLVSVILGILSMIVLAICAEQLLGARFGSATGVALLIVCGVLAATAICSLVVGVARNAEQASVAMAIVAMLLGILGGSFFSMARAGGAAAVVTKLTPHYWFGEGIARLTGGAPWTDALVPAAILLGIAVLFGIPGLLQSRRAVRL